MSKDPSLYTTAIVDDNEQFLLAMKAYLKKYSYINDPSTYVDSIEFISDFSQKPFDIVFMDLEMPSMNGDQVTKLIMPQNPSTKVIAVSMYEDGYSVKRMMEAGAWAFISKTYIQAKIPEMMERIKKGKRYVDPAAAENYTLFAHKVKKKTLADETPKSVDQMNDEEIAEINLTPGEKRVIAYMVQGYTHREIAEKLARSCRTIDTHTQNIMIKLNAHKATEIVLLAYKYKLI
jgi:DNA-binding NarL/FixJ family response regulator